MAQADSMFLKNNMLLLAQTYKMDMNQAMVVQAKLFDNPTMYAEANFYNPVKKQYFDAGSNGERILSVNQLIHIAGQRNQRVKLARENQIYGQFEFYDLLRTLKLELRNDFQTFYYSKLTIKKYDEQLSLLDTIIQALSYQSAKGNIPMKEVLRLKAVYYQLNTDRTELYYDLAESEKNLKTLLQTTAVLDIYITPEEQNKYRIQNLRLDSLISICIRNRPDLKMAESDLKQSQLNYSLQKRLAYPDLHLGGIFDQNGSYVPQYTGLTLGMDLPVFNRNQGNIRMARAGVEQSKALLKNKNNEVVNEVISSYQKLLEVENEYSKVDKDFGEHFDEINDGFVTNFHKRNISMLEFVDFFESYNASILQLNKLTEKRIQAYEQLNYVTGEELYK